ncbi:MAG TPA: flagellar assembly protein FliW [Bryobacteraceae bacterium]|nr:flagellar assembly protein FliW [Bryobacteraceae bacterium]
MPVAQTTKFGRISYDSGEAIDFPRGLPGFEDRRGFVALQFEDTAPLVFLQSLEVPDLCFVTMPVLAVDPSYKLQVSCEDLEEVGLSTLSQPRIGKDLLCLAVLSLRESGPTANLLAPVVVNLENLKAVQAVAPESGYSHQHPLVWEEAPVCS